MLLRVPTRTGSTPSAGRSGSSDLYEAHGMDPGDRHHHVLRFDRERATHGNDREASQRWKRATADTEVDSGGSHRRRSAIGERNRYWARTDDQSTPGQYLPALHPRRMV